MKKNIHLISLFLCIAMLYSCKKQEYLPVSASSPTDGAVLMQAIDGNPLNMKVNASFVDAASNTSCQFW